MMFMPKRLATYSYLRSAYVPPMPLPDFTMDTELADFTFDKIYISLSMDAAGVFFLCPECSGHKTILKIQKHPPKDDFYGVLNANCVKCGYEYVPLERKIAGMRFLRARQVKCTCKNNVFLFFHAKVATNGFFEEEAVAGRCLHCSQISLVFKAD